MRDNVLEDQERKFWIEDPPRRYDPQAVSDATGVDTGKETLVQQQFVQDADINTIVRRFGLTRELPRQVAGGVYGDFTGISDYRSALDQIERAQESFMKLPPLVREKFGNDPGKLVAYAQSVSREEFSAAMQVDEEVKPAEPGAV